MLFKRRLIQCSSTMKQFIQRIWHLLGLPTDFQSTALARARPTKVATSSDSSSSRAAPTTLYPECTNSGSSSSYYSSVESCENKKGAAAQRGSREKDMKDYAYAKGLIYFKVLYQPSHSFSHVWFLLPPFWYRWAVLCTYEETQPNPSQWSSSPSFVECGFIRRPFGISEQETYWVWLHHSGTAIHRPYRPLHHCRSRVRFRLLQPCHTCLTVYCNLMWFRPLRLGILTMHLRTLLFLRSGPSSASTVVASKCCSVRCSFSISEQHTYEPCLTHPAVQHPFLLHNHSRV